MPEFTDKESLIMTLSDSGTNIGNTKKQLHIAFDLRVFSNIATFLAVSTIALIAVLLNVEKSRTRSFFICALGSTFEWVMCLLAFVPVLSTISKYKYDKIRLEVTPKSTSFCVISWLIFYVLSVIESFLRSYARENGFLG